MARKTKAESEAAAAVENAPDPEETEQEYKRPEGFGGAAPEGDSGRSPAGEAAAAEEDVDRPAGFGGEAKRLKRADPEG